jgi:PAS domain S-box-containing protein
VSDPERSRPPQPVGDGEERFRTLADHIAQLAWMADASGWIFWYNERWFGYTGTTLDEMEGWGWRKVHHPDHVERVTETFRAAIAEGETWEDTFPLRSKDGEYRWFLSRAMPIRDDDGNVLRWFGTNTDITERMRMEEALREADRRKDLFLATLAHELRNPLAPIVSGLELLRRADRDDALKERVVGTLERQTRHLVRLVDDLLDVSRITRGNVALRRARVELDEILRSAVEASQPALDAAGHDLEIDLSDEPMVLDADATRLAQVFSNLLNNSARYTPRGGTIRIESAREAEAAVVRVIDSGIGLSEEVRERVFEMFYQVERAEGADPYGRGLRGDGPEDEGGLGIGLTLVRSLVKLHGGRVTVESEGPDRGSVFTVRLPVLAASSADEAPGAAGGAEASGDSAAGDGPGLRVLVVDDNRDAADALETLLELRGHTARAVYSGEEALEVGAELEPRVVLLDLGMPEVDGFETARRLRAEPWGRDVALVALTGWGQDSDRGKTREAGFDHHLVKPVDLPRLEKLLESVGLRR